MSPGARGLGPRGSTFEGQARGGRGARPSRAIELAVVFAVIGTALAAGVPACLRAIRLSRTAEASESLEKLTVAGALYLEQKNATKLVSTPTTPAQVPVGAPVTDAEGTWSHPTFKALAFEAPQPHWYAYRVEIDPDLTTPLRVVAHGDLDGDGVLSTFSRSLGREGNQIVVRPGLLVTQDLE